MEDCKSIKEIMEEKIKNLNKAWKLIKEAIKIIELEFKGDKYWDIQTFIGILKVDNDKLQKSIYRRLQQDYIDEEFDGMLKRLEEEE